MLNKNLKSQIDVLKAKINKLKSKIKKQLNREKIITTITKFQ